jgi:hypothetical protein
MLVIKHVENNQELLTQALAEMRPAYFYEIVDEALRLRLDGAEDFIAGSDDVAYLVSNEPLTDEQLVAEMRPHLIDEPDADAN